MVLGHISRRNSTLGGLMTPSDRIRVSWTGIMKDQADNRIETLDGWYSNNSNSLPTSTKTSK